MSLDINSTAQQIFTHLSAQDSQVDDKIGLKADGTCDNSIWNTFADAAGGKHISNYIEQENALKSIRTYLRNAINDVAKLTKIATAGGVTITSEEPQEEPVEEQPIEIQAETPDEAVETGDIVAIKNEDGTSYQINAKEHTITKYGADNSVIETREMTPEEQALRSNELIEKLKNEQETTSSDKDGQTDTTSELMNNLNKLKAEETYRLDQNNIYTRNDDGTITHEHVEAMHVSSEIKAIRLKEVLSEDGKNIISKERISTINDKGYYFGASAIITDEYNNDGKKESSTADLSNYGEIGLLPLNLAVMNAMDHSEAEKQEVLDQDGNVILTRDKDGNFYNANGKQINTNRATRLLEKANKDNNIAKLKATYDV